MKNRIGSAWLLLCAAAVVPACGGGGGSGAGAPVVAVPGAPIGLIAVAGNGEVDLSWTGSADAAEYRIYRAGTSGGPYTQIGTSSVVSYNDPGLPNGVSVFYVVSAANAAGESPFSTQAEATPLAPDDAAGPFTKAAGPVLSPSVALWDSEEVMNPSVLKLAPSSYMMWYEGADALNFVYQIGAATSTDGVLWSKIANPVLAPGGVNAFDQDSVGEPCVVFDGATYRMWYAGAASFVDFQIGLATSVNGTTWTKNGLLPVLPRGGSGAWDAGAVYSPHVVLDGGVYKMWYTGINAAFTDGGIGYATSADGVTWTKHPGNPVLAEGLGGAFDDGGVFAPSVMKDGSLYRMWYSGADGAGGGGTWRTGYASSSDGVVWTRAGGGGPALEVGSAGTWNAEGVYGVSVLLDGAAFKMWFTGEDAALIRRIGYATSP